MKQDFSEDTVNEGWKRWVGAAAGRFVTPERTPMVSKETITNSLPHIGDTRRVIVAAGGPSLWLNVDRIIYGDDDLMIADQSSLFWLRDHNYYPDMVVLSDPNKAATEKLKDAIERSEWSGLVVAGVHVDLDFDYDNTLFMPMLLVRNGEVATRYNNIISSMFAGDLFIAQAGSVTNATVLLCAALKRAGIWKPKDVVLVGVDLMNPYNEEEGLFHTHVGEVSSVGDPMTKPEAFEEYRKQLAMILEVTKGDIHVTLANPGSPLLSFVEEWHD